MSYSFTITIGYAKYGTLNPTLSECEKLGPTAFHSTVTILLSVVKIDSRHFKFGMFIEHIKSQPTDD